LTRDEEITLYRQTKRQTCGNGEWQRGTRGSLFRSYPRPRHECENQGRVSYSHITFATLESHRDTPFSLSSFFSFVQARPSLLSLSIYFQDGDAAILCLSCCMYVQRNRSLRPISPHFHSFTFSAVTENIRHKRCCENFACGKIDNYIFTCFERVDCQIYK